MNIICFPFIFYNCEQTLFILRGSLLLSSLKDASVDILDHEGSFEFSPKAQFTSPFYVHITLATRITALHTTLNATVLETC